MLLRSDSLFYERPEEIYWITIGSINAFSKKIKYQPQRPFPILHPHP